MQYLEMRMQLTDSWEQRLPIHEYEADFMRYNPHEESAYKQYEAKYISPKEQLLQEQQRTSDDRKKKRDKKKEDKIKRKKSEWLSIVKF